MKVLIACEESQAVCKAFRELGHEAFSCDIIECSGGHPEWHIKDDALKYINGRCSFETCDGKIHTIDEKWDLLIAHPPCTYLSNAGAARLYPQKVLIDAARLKNGLKAKRFFMNFYNADCDKICVENPVGFMSKAYKKPTQIINPYQFADSISDKENYVTKRTCLWIKGLQPLETNSLPYPNLPKRMTKTGKLKSITWEETITKDRARTRSKTFPGIARAMADQWGGQI